MPLQNLPAFLQSNTDGCVSIANHRITLEQFLWYYQNGSSPEALHEQFPTLSMSLIHQILSFYWDQKSEVDSFLADVRLQLEMQRKNGHQVDIESLRKRLAEREAMLPAKAG